MGKISGYPQDTSLSINDFVVGVQKAGGASSKKVSILDLKAALGLPLPNVLRRQYMNKTADGGTAVIGNLESNEIKFTGNSNYGRLDCRVPLDYVSGTNATIHLALVSDSTNNETLTRFVGSHTIASAESNWNLLSSSAGSAMGLTANNVVDYTFYQILSTNLTVGGYITAALIPSTTITGNIYVLQAWLEYTAQY